MKATTILNNVISLVSYKMHKTRRSSLIACVESLMSGSAATITSIGRGIRNNAFEKHRIKRADRLLSNRHLLTEVPFLYAVLCQMFCSARHPVISVDWSDLDTHKGHFLLRAAISVKGRPVTLYQEVHCAKTKEKPTTHKAFLEILRTILPSTCQPIIVTDAGYKSPWFRAVSEHKWYIVGRIRKPHFCSAGPENHWQSVTCFYELAGTRPKRFDNARITKSHPFDCTLVLVRNKNKGRHALNAHGRRKTSKCSLEHSASGKEPWLLATSLPPHRNLAKQVVSIYRQRMQIEEGFRDLKSTRFGLGFEQNKTGKKNRLTILVLLTTLASIVAILLGMSLVVSGKHRRFQANTERKQVLSFHTLGLRAYMKKTEIYKQEFKQALQWLTELINTACLPKVQN